MSNWTLTDRILLGFASLLLAGSSYFLYDDSLLFPATETDNLEKIGNVQMSQNDVRVKNATSFSWVPAQKADIVHLQDSLFTGDRSQATIVLRDGTVLHLKENSLVTLKMNEGQMSLDLRYGDLASELSENSKLKITAGEQVLELEGVANPEAPGKKSTVRLNKASAGSVDVKLVQGAAKLKTKSASNPAAAPQALPLKKDENLSYNRSGAIKDTKAPVLEAVTAEQTQFLRIKEDDPLRFSWKGDESLSSYEVEICSDEKCEPPLLAKTTRDNEILFREALPEGEYSWRVRGFDLKGDQAVVTAGRKFKVTSTPPPRLDDLEGSDPSVRAEMEVRNLKDPLFTKTRLSWAADPRYTKYEYEIARDEAFTDKVDQGFSEDGTVETKALSNGLYHYHVRGILPDGKPGPWSDKSQFQIELTAKLPERPEAPKWKTALVYFNPDEELTRNPAATPTPVLSWTKSPRAQSYLVQISRDESFQQAKSYNVKAESMRWSDYQAGTWKTRVIAVGPTGLRSLASATGEIRVRLGEPRLVQIKSIEKLGMDVDAPPPQIEWPAKWTPVASADRYLVELATKPDFSDAKQFETKGTGLGLPTSAPGTYHVRVKARAADGSDLTDFSKSVSATYTYKWALRSPALAEPFDKASIFLQSTQEPFIWLEWKKVKDATTYELEVSKDPQFSQILFRSQQKESRYLIRQQIPEGKLYWRVRARLDEEDRRSEWAPTRVFHILTQKNEVF